MRLNPRPRQLLSAYVLRRFGAKVDRALASAPIFSTAPGCGALTSVKPRPAAICLGAPKQNRGGFHVVEGGVRGDWRSAHCERGVACAGGGAILAGKSR